MRLKNFQINAIQELKNGWYEGHKNLILKSPTGSGKTIILTNFMNDYIHENPNIVFVWLTPGKGDLEEQSKHKMDLYIHNSSTKLLNDVMTSGFSENDCCFINWEKLTKKGNNALKDSERTNFLEWIEKALNSNLEFRIIIDESHQNFTEKADAIIQLFKTDKIIRCSATPKIDKQSKLIEIEETDVIAEGLIKKMLCINEDFPQTVNTDNETHYLLEAAYKKQQILRTEFLKLNKDINPLIIVQLPNNSDTLMENVINFFEKNNISIENGLLGVWLSNQHENLDNISENDSKQVAVIIKQAIATGWDCPRAAILVKLREGMDETFEVQTIGRIRRMPEAVHYNNDLLDSCYLYTFDPKFTMNVQAELGKGALNAKTLFIKNELRDFKLTKQQRSVVNEDKDDVLALESITNYLIKTYNLVKDPEENKTRLETNNFIFDNKIVRNTFTGIAHTLDEVDSNNLSKIKIKEKVNTHVHGREFHNRIGRIGAEIGIDYATAVTIIGKLFANENKFLYERKLLKLTIKEWYSFVINNFDELRHVFRLAMADNDNQASLGLDIVSEKDFFIPRSVMFTYDGNNKLQIEYNKNAYKGYLSSAEFRSGPEKQFEKFCETFNDIDWWYKNGDKGDEYFSIVYLDNSHHQKLFYPDYIVSIRKEIWIIETKGGFDRSGNSEDIDIFSAKKCEVLNNYVQKYKLHGGFVRYDKASMELFICQGEYNDDLSSDSWKLLKDI